MPSLTPEAQTLHPRLYVWSTEGTWKWSWDPGALEILLLCIWRVQEQIWKWSKKRHQNISAHMESCHPETTRLIWLILIIRKASIKVLLSKCLRIYNAQFRFVSNLMSSVLWLYKLLLRQKWITPKLQGKVCINGIQSAHSCLIYKFSSILCGGPYLHNSPYLESLIEKSIPDLEEDVTGHAVHKHNQEPVEGDESGVHLIMLKMSMKPG